MKIYIDEAEIGSTISYTEENGKKQNLYVHDKEGFVFKSLKEKLAEKDKEIEKLENARNVLANTLERLLFGNTESYKQELRHEICEKIRDKCVYVAGTKKICDNTSISTYNLNEILNQIEGEK